MFNYLLTKVVGEFVSIGRICVQKLSKQVNRNDSILYHVRDKSAWSTQIGIIIIRDTKECRQRIVWKPHEGSALEGEVIA